MKIVPSTRCPPSDLIDLVGEMLHLPASNITHDFKIEDPFLTLYDKGFLPEGSHLEEEAPFMWSDCLRKAVAEKTKSGTPIWDLIPGGAPLPQGDLLIHKRFTSTSFSGDSVELFRNYAIPLYAALGLLVSVDPTKPCKGSPLSGVVENYIPLVTEKGEIVFMRVLYNGTGHEKKWVLFPPATSIPQNKVVIFKGN